MAANLPLGHISAGTVRAGYGCREIRLPSGVIIEATHQRRTASARDTTKWREVSSRIQGSNFKIYIYPSSINRVIPENIFDELSCNVNGTFFLKAICTTNGKTLTGIELVLDEDEISTDNQALKNAAPPEFQVCVGIVNDGIYYQVETVNLEYEPRISFVSERVPPGPGEEPFERWWTWTRKTDTP